MSEFGLALSELNGLVGLQSQSDVTGPGAPPDSRRILDALPAAVYITDAGGRITYFNEAAAALWGCRPQLDSDLWCGSWRLYHLDGTPMPHDTCPMAIALKERRPVRGQQAAAERPDGTRVRFLAYPTPLYDQDGTFAGAVNMLMDMTEQRRAEDSERHLVAIVESSDDAIVSKDLNGVILSWNRGAERLFGYFAQEVLGKSITILIPAELQDEETRILERIRRGERIEHFETTRQRKDGSRVSISLTISPITDESGRIVGASKIARDISDQKRREEQIALLAREADHRTKNLLTLAQATVHLTDAGSAADLKTAIAGRLSALANAHALLARSRWTGADLRHLVLEELSPYCEEDHSHAQIDGPDLTLDQESAQAMALALHELTTNAVKYGALSMPSGRVNIEWRLKPGQRLHLRWSESGGPPVKPPDRRGFGTRAMRRICEQLNGELKFNWRETGLVCDIAVDI